MIEFYPQIKHYHILLAVLTQTCFCGAPFDLEATPNFSARLAEAGFRWPPPETISFPPRAAP